MKCLSKKLVFTIIIVLIILFSLYGLYRFSKSRTSQAFGKIVYKGESHVKRIALTFDDGPTEQTDKILKVLNKLDVKATFFLTGKESENNMALAKRIEQAGHQIGNHSYSHERMVLKSYSFIKEEIELTNELIRKAGYEGDIVFRAPYCKKLFSLPLYLKNVGMTHVTWNIEPDTYLQSGATAQEIANYVIDNAENGSIVLMHLMYEANKTNIEALPYIVDGLKAKGYELVTVNELLND